jgi:hypothetical protein
MLSITFLAGNILTIFKEKAEQNFIVAEFAENNGHFSVATSRYYYRILFLLQDRFDTLNGRLKNSINFNEKIEEYKKNNQSHQLIKERHYLYMNIQNKNRESKAFLIDFRTIKDLRNTADYDNFHITVEQLATIKKAMTEIEKVI